MKKKWALAAVLSLGFLAFGCGGDDDSDFFFNGTGFATVTVTPGAGGTSTATVTPSPGAGQELLYGLGENLGGQEVAQELVVFSSAHPDRLLGRLRLDFLENPLASIDFDPVSGGLFGVTENGAVLRIAALDGFSFSQGSVEIEEGARLEIDVDPTNQALRVIGGLANSSIRLLPPFTSTAETGLAYAGDDVAAGQTPVIGGVAYTNNAPGASSTTLLGIDSARGTLVTFPNPNDGVIRTLGSIAGQNELDSRIGFDISGSSSVAYVSVNPLLLGRRSDIQAAQLAPSGNTRLYTLDPQVTPPTIVDRGEIGYFEARIISIAVVPPVAEPPIAVRFLRP